MRSEPPQRERNTDLANRALALAGQGGNATTRAQLQEWLLRRGFTEESLEDFANGTDTDARASDATEARRRREE